jgi:hypothetical protein
MLEDRRLLTGLTLATQAALASQPATVVASPAAEIAPLLDVPPTVTITTPTTPQSGNVRIHYTLTDANSDICSITVEFSRDGGTTWFDATAGSGGAGTTGLSSSPTGVAHMFVWASGSDIVSQDNATVEIRIAPSDTALGTSATTDDFLVANHMTTPGLYDYYDSMFRLKNTLEGGLADEKFAFGKASSGWKPLAGDWTGSGNDTIGVYDPATSTFRLKYTMGGGAANNVFAFGNPNASWTPLAGDWTDTGSDGIGLYDPSTSTFRLKNTLGGGAADEVVVFGKANSGWIPLVGDWDGNGTDTIGLYDPSTSTFRLKNSLQGGSADIVFTFGQPYYGWVPLAGDWDGNGADSIGFYEPSSSTFRLKNTFDGGAADEVFIYGSGNRTWAPIVGNWASLGQSLEAAGGEAVAASGASVTQADLQPIVQEAIARWNGAGLDAATVKKLSQVQIVLTDLPGSELGEAVGNTVFVDSNAAGYGWFVDATAGKDEEFATSTVSKSLHAVDPQALDHIDLLTVVEHELGHIAGLDDLDASADSLMTGVLGVGTRRSPTV